MSIQFSFYCVFLDFFFFFFFTNLPLPFIIHQHWKNFVFGVFLISKISLIHSSIWRLSISRQSLFCKYIREFCLVLCNAFQLNCSILGSEGISQYWLKISEFTNSQQMSLQNSIQSIARTKLYSSDFTAVSVNRSDRHFESNR